MTVNDSVGRGAYQGFTTESTTSAITTGKIVEFDSSGDIVLPTSTPIVDQIAGVTASEVAARTTASKEDIIVQTSGLAHIACAANSAFAEGKFVRVATAGTGAGYASTAAEATTITSTALAAVIGKVVTPDATTTGTTVIVKLTI